MHLFKDLLSNYCVIDTAKVMYKRNWGKSLRQCLLSWKFFCPLDDPLLPPTGRSHTPDFSLYLPTKTNLSGVPQEEVLSANCWRVYQFSQAAETKYH